MVESEGASMKLIIDIPESMYEGVIKDRILDTTVIRILNAIRNGIPLPKRHGRLIDADELKRIIQGNDVFSMTGFNVRICDINATPTIIEADTTEEKEGNK